MAEPSAPTYRPYDTPTTFAGCLETDDFAVFVPTDGTAPVVYSRVGPHTASEPVYSPYSREEIQAWRNDAAVLGDLVRDDIELSNRVGALLAAKVGQ